MPREGKWNHHATITPRQRVWQAIRHQQPDRVPWHLGCTVPARQKLEAYYGTADLDDVLGNHLAKYRTRLPDEPIEGRPGFWRDEFGVVWNRTVDKDIGVVERHPLKQRSLDWSPSPIRTTRAATPACRPSSRPTPTASAT